MLEESDFRTGLNKHPNFLEAKKTKECKRKKAKQKDTEENKRRPKETNGYKGKLEKTKEGK